MMLNGCDVKVGDRVAKVKPGGTWAPAKVTFHDVTRVTKVSLTLDDGSVWTRKGDLWGSASSYSSRAPFLVDEEDGRNRDKVAKEAQAEIDHRNLVNAHLDGLVSSKRCDEELLERARLLVKYLEERSGS